MDGFNNRLMFEWYIYDYLKKNNMQETAENFLREVNFPFDPARVSPAVDVPDGFLKEWWGFFYDVYRNRQLSAPDQGEGSSSTMLVEQMMGARQQVDPSLSVLPVMNEQTILGLEAACGLNARNNTMGSMNPSKEVEKFLEGISLSSYPQDWLALTLGPNTGDLADLIGQEVGSSVPAASIKEEVASNEETELIPPGFANDVSNPIWVTENHQKELWDGSHSLQSGEESANKLHLEDGKCSLLGDAGATSKTSLTKYKSCADDAKSSSSKADVKKQVADLSSSKLPGCARAPDNLIEASLPKYKSCGGNAKSSSSDVNVNKEDADFSSSKLPRCARAPNNLIVNQLVKVKTKKDW